MIREKELLQLHSHIEKELSVMLGSSLSLFQYEVRQKQERDRIG